MSERRDHAGRLDMDTVRGGTAQEQQVHNPAVGEVFLSHNWNTLDYTAAWVNQVEPPQEARSLSAPKDAAPDSRHTRRKAARSAPALSTRSRVSNKSTVVRSKLELELKYMREKQKLDKEQREIDLEMKRQQIEREQKLAELEERRKLHELEAKLNEAQLQEQLEDDEEQDLESNEGDDVPVHINVRQAEPGMAASSVLPDELPERGNAEMQTTRAIVHSSQPVRPSALPFAPYPTQLQPTHQPPRQHSEHARWQPGVENMQQAPHDQVPLQTDHHPVLYREQASDPRVQQPPVSFLPGVIEQRPTRDDLRGYTQNNLPPQNSTTTAQQIFEHQQTGPQFDGNHHRNHHK